MLQRTSPIIRLVAVDLDGTLLNDSKKVSDQTVAAFHCLPERNVKVIIASARPPRSVRHIYSSLHLDTWQINYNGALIWDEPQKRPVFHCPMPGPFVRRLVDFARDLFDEVLVSCEICDQWFTDRADQSHTTETGRLFKPDRITDLETCCAQDVTKLMLLGEPRIISRLEHEIATRYHDVSVIRTDPDLIQIMNRSASKSIALEKVADHYQIPLDQILAIGDAPNDVGMLQLAGVSVAMDNAHPIVKDVADWIAPSNNDHGVHAALKRYGLCD